MVMPIVDPVVELAVTPALYPVPPIPVLAVADPVPVLVASPLRPVEGSLDLDQSRSHLVSPSDSGSEPIRPGSRRRSGQMIFPECHPAWLRWTSTCRGMLHCCRGGGGGGGESTDIPDLPAPLTPRQIIEEMVSGSVAGVTDRGACCCGLPEYAGLVSGGPL